MLYFRYYIHFSLERRDAGELLLRNENAGQGERDNYGSSKFHPDTVPKREEFADKRKCEKTSNRVSGDLLTSSNSASKMKKKKQFILPANKRNYKFMNNIKRQLYWK